jgi:hypothetical protein
MAVVYLVEEKMVCFMSLEFGGGGGVLSCRLGKS